MEKNLKVFRGDTFLKSLTFTHSSGDPVDLTGATVIFTIKSAVTDPDAEAVLQKRVTEHTNPTEGITTLQLTASEMDTVPVGVFYYDIQLTLADADLVTVLAGTFSVKQDITTSKT